MGAPFFDFGKFHYQIPPLTSPSADGEDTVALAIAAACAASLSFRQPVEKGGNGVIEI